MIGLALGCVGLYATSERNRILAAAKELVIGGPERALSMLQQGVTYRRRLDELKKLADSMPPEGMR